MKAIQFSNPCSLESGLTKASETTRKWLNSHKEFNANFDGFHLVLTSLDNNQDWLRTSTVISVEHAGCWYRFETANSIINLFDKGFEKPVFTLPRPEPVVAKQCHLNADQFDYEKVAKVNADRLAKWELEKTIFEKYGFYAVKVDRETHNNYGSWVKENYEFSREITKEEFVVYLKAINANLVPKKVDAPVCQGEINLYPTNRRWSDTSECWTRHETFVYYD